MVTVCKACGGLEPVEKEHDSLHKKGVYCSYCNAFIKWGDIVSKDKVPDGKHLANVRLAEELDKTDGTKQIFLSLAVEGYKDVKHFIQKVGTKYNPIKISDLLEGFNKPAIPFKTIQDLFTFIQGKNTIIHTKKGWIQDWEVMDTDGKP